MLNNIKKIHLIAGENNIKHSSCLPFDRLVINFVTELSNLILKNKKFKIFPDLITFAFWCRNKNLLKIKNVFLNDDIKKNIGLILHIPPTNVPISLAYSFILGLLTGNSNIVRVPRPNISNIKEFLKLVNELMKKSRYSKIRKNNAFISYENSFEISEKLSNLVDGRIIWGGDKTSILFKKMKTKVSCKDIFFFDKYSISIMDLDKFISLRGSESNKMVENFYNDTFIMDQNACSSPHLILWRNFNLKKSKIFWNKLDSYVSTKYDFNKENKIFKYYKFNEILINSKNISNITYLNNINICTLKKLEQNITNLRGYGGIFFQYKFEKYEDLLNIVNRTFQTLTYFGINKIELKRFVSSYKLKGIDRVVPVGGAVDFGEKWDGYDLLSELTRITNFR